MPIQPRITDEEFQDIRIIDLDLGKTTWSRVHETLRVMYLRLDRDPPDTDWSRLFFEERETRIVARRRGLWIEDNYISFDTLPEEVDKIHLPDIRISLAYANRKYRELALQRRLKRQQEQAMQRSERDELLAVQARVRGLLGDTPGEAPVAPVVARAAAALAAAKASAAAVAASRTALPGAVKTVAAAPAAAVAAAASAPKPPAASDAAAIAAPVTTTQPVAPVATAPLIAAPAEPPRSSATAAGAPATTPAGAAGTVSVTPPAAAEPSLADALAEFRLRRDALKQRFRHAAAPQDKEHNNGND